MTAENEENKNVNDTATRTKTQAKKATAAADRAKSDSAVAASKAKSSARQAGEAADSGVRSAGLATRRMATAGWETGRQTVASTVGKAASTAGTAWTVVKHRKAVAVGAAAGIGGLVGGAFALGRQTAKVHGGPITRLTGGRI
ncbi:hypothetical protein [Streptomyces nitrosporeus]|uniref:Uncharacterized protein n=1 Tax=Streptomyces nitrosporeus TaxID=28894 RepID=A0A5J6F4N9_9ACTN|nr:hypothetical protein [Streptomyces nitrosporeus]QEU70774.1 hypothetical protein CP967_01310 [Streptomyces nitrosporeus]GGZ24408.1 hypothetical protein GCM10010327_63980 [Streptomyces nitrosporeus]